MFSLQESIDIIQQRIKAVELPGEPAELYEPIEYILSIGGKRLRPALVLLGANLFSEEIEPALPAALAVEVFHNFTLLHDDIMDHAERRRGKPTVHMKWNENTAILSGDAMCIYAYIFISRLNADHLPAVLKVFNETALQICEGQQMDMNFEQIEEVSIREYMKMIELKTAVLLAAGLKMGALSVDAPPGEADKLYDFGKNLGLAFQLQDDLLDSFGDPERFGKKIGGDILAGKKTYLILSAFREGGAAVKNEILELFNAKGMKEQKKIARVRSLLKSWGVRENTETRIKKYYEAALKFLSDIKVDQERKKILENFAARMMSRDK